MQRVTNLTRRAGFDNWAGRIRWRCQLVPAGLHGPLAFEVRLLVASLSDSSMTASGLPRCIDEGCREHDGKAVTKTLPASGDCGSQAPEPWVASVAVGVRPNCARKVPICPM